MVNLTAAERVYEYWIDKASSAADLVLKIVFAVILFLVARKLILWLCGLIRKNMRRFHTEDQDCDIGRSGACAGDGAGFQPAYFCSYWCDLGDEPYLGGFTQGEP